MMHMNGEKLEKALERQSDPASPTGEFTKKIKRTLSDCNVSVKDAELGVAGIFPKLLIEACDIIDRLEAEIKELKNRYTDYCHTAHEVTGKLQAELKAKDAMLRKAADMLVRYFNRHGKLYEYTPTEIAKLITDIEALKGNADG